MSDRLFVIRTHPKKEDRFVSEWLPGEVGDDPASEARALLSDPRDTIVSVYLWSNRHNQFTNRWLKRQEFPNQS